MFLRATKQNTKLAKGHKPRGRNIGCTEKEIIAYDKLPYQALESLLRMGTGSALCLEDRLSELADYRKIQGHCNVPIATVNTPNWLIGCYQRTQYIGSSESFHRL
jgi:hypothetical protein